MSLSHAEATALLTTLEAQHGAGVLAALAAAALSGEIDDYEKNAGESAEGAFADTDWAAGIPFHPDFRAALSERAKTVLDAAEIGG